MMNKRFLAIATTACTLAGSSLAVFAAPANMGQMPQGGPGGSAGMMQGNGQEPPALPEGVEEGELPELPEGVEAGERPELPEGMEAGERPELPEGVEEGELPELPEGMDEEMRGMGPGMAKGDGSDLYDKLTEMAATVEDEDTRSNLETLISAFTEALDAERDALESGEATEEELEALKEAVDTSKAALDTAMSEAGLSIPKRNEEPSFENRETVKSTDSDETPAFTPDEKPAFNPDEMPTFTSDDADGSATDISSSDSSEKTGFFSRLGSAIGGFFSRLFNR